MTCDLMKQLTFGHLRRQDRPPRRLREIPENISVQRADRKRIKPQTTEIYERLKRGPVWTNELAGIGKQYNARIKELRNFLSASCMTVDMTFQGPDGNNRYEIKPLAGSNYQKQLIARGKRI
jgi:hypothetical protein